VHALARLESRAGSAVVFDACLWVSTPDEADTVAIDRVRQMLRPGGRLFIFLVQAPDAESAATKAACGRVCAALHQWGIEPDRICYLRAGVTRAWLAHTLARLIRAGRDRARLALPLVLAAGTLTLGAIFVCNVMLLGRSTRRPPRGDCSSIVIAARTAVAGTEAAIDCTDAHGYDGPQRGPAADEPRPRVSAASRK
jgi:hypothetical protein